MGPRQIAFCGSYGRDRLAAPGVGRDAADDVEQGGQSSKDAIPKRLHRTSSVAMLGGHGRCASATVMCMPARSGFGVAIGGLKREMTTKGATRARFARAVRRPSIACIEGLHLYLYQIPTRLAGFAGFEARRLYQEATGPCRRRGWIVGSEVIQAR